MDYQIADRIRGTILGSACANSLGGALVGVARKEILLSYGLRGIRDFAASHKNSLLWDYQPAALLADTLQALTLAESLVANSGLLNPDDLRERLSQLLTNKQFLDGGPGIQCLTSLRTMVDNPQKQLAKCASTHVNAACRAYPIGCLPDKTNVVNVAVCQAQLSESSQQVAAGAAVLADSVRRFIHGQHLDSEDAVHEYLCAEFAIASEIDSCFAEAWEDVAPDLDYEDPALDLPYSLINVNSHVNEAVPTAVGIFLIFRHNLEEAIVAAASCGGDTDTVAAIVGALSGAYHGASVIPERWLNTILDRQHLETVANSLVTLWH